MLSNHTRSMETIYKISQAFICVSSLSRPWSGLVLGSTRERTVFNLGPFIILIAASCFQRKHFNFRLIRTLPFAPQEPPVNQILVYCCQHSRLSQQDPSIDRCFCSCATEAVAAACQVRYFPLG